MSLTYKSATIEDIDTVINNFDKAPNICKPLYRKYYKS